MFKGIFKWEGSYLKRKLKWRQCSSAALECEVLGNVISRGTSGHRSPMSLAFFSEVVAIVMDIFTDVDLLFEVLDAAARRVPVYILLDEMNSQLFLDTAAKCRVNLNYVEVSKPKTLPCP